MLRVLVTGCVAALFLCPLNSAGAGQLSDALGLYLADADGKCRAGEMGDDQNIQGVCIPARVLIASTTNSDGLNSDILFIAVTELTDPAGAEYLRKEYARKLQPVSEAFEVEIDSYGGDFFKLTDGTVLEKRDSTYIGYIGYHEDAVLYQDASQWYLCVSGDSAKVDLIKEGSSYGRRRITATLIEIEKMDPCS